MSTEKNSPVDDVQPLEDAALESVSGGMSGLEEAGLIGAGAGLLITGIAYAPLVMAEGLSAVAKSEVGAIFGAVGAAGSAVGAGVDEGAKVAVEGVKDAAKGVEEGYDWLKSKL